MSEPSILVLKPRQITAAARKELLSAGVVVVEVASPESVRFLRPNAELSTTDMLTAAMKALQRAGHHTYFGEEIAKALLMKAAKP